MRERLLVAGVALVVGAAAGWFARDLLRPSVPTEIGEACSVFQSAYDDAAELADQANEAFDQDQLAHPVRVNEVWRARHQAMLEEAVDIATDAAARRPQDWAWWPVTAALGEAQQALNPNLAYSSVDQQEALGGAVVACLGRG